MQPPPNRSVDHGVSTICGYLGAPTNIYSPRFLSYSCTPDGKFSLHEEVMYKGDIKLQLEPQERINKVTPVPVPASSAEGTVLLTHGSFLPG